LCGSDCEAIVIINSFVPRHQNHQQDETLRFSFRFAYQSSCTLYAEDRGYGHEAGDIAVALRVGHRREVDGFITWVDQEAGYQRYFFFMTTLASCVTSVVRGPRFNCAAQLWVLAAVQGALLLVIVRTRPFIVPAKTLLSAAMSALIMLGMLLLAVDFSIRNAEGSSSGSWLSKAAEGVALAATVLSVPKTAPPCIAAAAHWATTPALLCAGTAVRMRRSCWR
jgi:hypothetical protein